MFYFEKIIEKSTDLAMLLSDKHNSSYLNCAEDTRKVTHFNYIFEKMDVAENQ